MSSKLKETTTRTKFSAESLPYIHFFSLLHLQERRIGSSRHGHKEGNRNASKVGDKQFGEDASDTSEGDSSRRHDNPTIHR